MSDTDVLLCYDLNHPEEDRAPFCTKIANRANLVEGIEGIGPDMYFCDECFRVGNEQLNVILQGIEDGVITREEFRETLETAAEANANKPVKKGRN